MARGGCCKVGEECSPVDPLEFVDHMSQAARGAKLLFSVRRAKLPCRHGARKTMHFGIRLAVQYEIDSAFQRCSLATQPTQEAPESAWLEHFFAGESFTLFGSSAVPSRCRVFHDRSTRCLVIFEVAACQFFERLPGVLVVRKNEKRDNP